MLAGSGVNDPSTELNPSVLEAPQRMGSVAVGQSASRSVVSNHGDELFSQASISSSLPPGADLVCPIFVYCPVVAGDRSLRVDAHYTTLAHLPTPGAVVLAWNKSGTVSVITSDVKELEMEFKDSPVLTLTRCVQSKRVKLSVTPPFEIASRILSLKVCSLNPTKRFTNCIISNVPLSNVLA